VQKSNPNPIETHKKREAYAPPFLPYSY